MPYVTDNMHKGHFPPVFLYLLLYTNTQCVILLHLSPDTVPERPSNLVLEGAKILGNIYLIHSAPSS